MPVSERDRAYMRRIGGFKAESHAQSAEIHRAANLVERLRRSWNLFLSHRDRAQCVAEDDPSPFYDRARELGLYKP